MFTATELVSLPAGPRHRPVRLPGPPSCVGHSGATVGVGPVRALRHPGAHPGRLGGTAAENAGVRRTATGDRQPDSPIQPGPNSRAQTAGPMEPGPYSRDGQPARDHKPRLGPNPSGRLFRLKLPDDLQRVPDVLVNVDHRVEDMPDRALTVDHVRHPAGEQTQHRRDPVLPADPPALVTEQREGQIVLASEGGVPLGRVGADRRSPPRRPR